MSLSDPKPNSHPNPNPKSYTYCHKLLSYAIVGHVNGQLDQDSWSE